jgi:hypothetical protein
MFLGWCFSLNGVHDLNLTSQIKLQKQGAEGAQGSGASHYDDRSAMHGQRSLARRETVATLPSKMKHQTFESDSDI